MLPQESLPVTAEKQESLRARTRELRLQAIDAQLLAATTFCRVAKNGIILRDFHKAQMAIEHARHAMELVRRHIAEPNHVPPESLPEIRRRLKQLEKSIAKTEPQLTGK